MPAPGGRWAPLRGFLQPAGLSGFPALLASLPFPAPPGLFPQGLPQDPCLIWLPSPWGADGQCLPLGDATLQLLCQAEPTVEVRLTLLSPTACCGSPLPAAG